MQLFLFILLLGLCVTSPIGQAYARDSVDLGRAIYEKGVGRDGRAISATVHGSVMLTGAVVACAGCHGSNGRGGGEAFIQAPDIRWVSLSKLYPARRPGFAEASYDSASFARALRTGNTSSGRTLDPAMPRFDLADDEIHSLIDYLGIIDEARNAERGRSAILGLLPAPGQNLLADALDAELRNCAATRNGALVAALDVMYFITPDDAIAKLNDRLSVNPAAIVVAPFVAGWEQQYAQAMRHNDALTVLSFSLFDAADENQWLFPLPGLEAQIRALLKSAATLGYRTWQLRYDPNHPLSSQLAAIGQQMAMSLELTLVAEHSGKTKQKKFATLWLQPVSPDQVHRTASQNELMLVPGIFFKPDSTSANAQNIAGIEWRIAYPYPPIDPVRSAWRTPVEVWARVACDFLSLTAQQAFHRTDLPDSLHGEAGVTVWRNPSLEMLADQVFIDKLPKH